MNSLKRKFIVSIMLVVLCFSNISTLVLALSSESEKSITNNTIMNNIYNNENVNSNVDNNFNITIDNSTDNSMDMDDSSIELNDEITQFDVILAGILKDKNSILEYSNIKSAVNSNQNIAEKKGIWIEKASREYFLKLINDNCNANYNIGDDGFLEKFETAESNKYIEKINQIIDNANGCIIISIEEHYNSVNNEEKEILEMIIEDEEFALLFQNEYNNANISDIIVLNKRIYNDEKESYKSLNLEEPIEDTEKLNHLLEKLINENDEYDEFINSNENECDSNEDMIINNEVLENIETIEELDTPIDLEGNNEDELEIFDVILSGILYSENEITLENIINVNEIKPTNYGIWIEESSRNMFLDFLNNHGAYTYSVNEDGYLLCDNIIKNNPNLDFVDVTEVDLEIATILSEDILLIVRIDDRYLNRENGIITYSDLTNEEYVLTFDNGNYDSRIVILNSMYFNENTGYDVAISDRLIKKIFDFGYDIQLYSDTSKYGYMTESRNVYFGPSESNYATVGSVDLNEKIYLLGQSSGWYHIQYHVGTSGKQKSGYVPISTVTNIVANPPVHEEILIGGHRYANNQITIYSCDDLDIAVSVGTVFQGESVSLIYNYAYSDAEKNYNIAFVEYSTSSGTKRGYTYTSNLNSSSYTTSIARIISTSSAYSGPDTSYVKLGGAYFNEYVAVLAKNGDWWFVEYNTSSGRKRGYMRKACLSEFNATGTFQGFVSHQSLKKASLQVTVYGGPNSNYANIGTIFNQEVVSLLGTERDFSYIEYTTSTGAKRGYVSTSALVNAEAVVLPNFINYTNSPKQTYGTSGLGQELVYYKIGNGPNVAFAIFAQHGWEDAWASDGIELVKIAQDLVNTLSTNGINSNWTLYVVPCANPDGITNGYTNNGPGRCTVTSHIDMNRSWPANFVVDSNSRNYTGVNPLSSTEGDLLEEFITNHKGTNNEKIILDIHGWLNKTYGNADLSTYFTQQFGFSHSTSYGNGYLATWGKSIGAKSLLVEFPNPSSASDIITNNYSGKLINAVTNMLNSYAIPTNGVDVDETVFVNTDNLNLRTGPALNYSTIRQISINTLVNRIQKSVGTSDGYTWDKIKLNDGTEGYVVNQYLTYIDDRPTVEGTTYIRNKTEESIEIQGDAAESIGIGENEYNSKNLLVYLLNYDELLAIHTSARAAALLSQTVLPNASPGLTYYLTKGNSGNTLGAIEMESEPFSTDHTIRTFNFKNCYDVSSQIQSTVATAMNNSLQAAEKIAYCDGLHNFANEQEIGSSVDDNKDAKYLLNNYRYNTLCSVTKTGNVYGMDVTFVVKDYYDWYRDDGLEFLSELDIMNDLVEESEIEVLSGVLRDMHINGDARNYTNKSTLTIRVEWSYGNRIGSGAQFEIRGVNQ